MRISVHPPATYVKCHDCQNDVFVDDAIFVERQADRWASAIGLILGEWLPATYCDVCYDRKKFRYCYGEAYTLEQRGNSWLRIAYRMQR